MNGDSQCRSCHAPLIWAETVKGRHMPLDKQPAHDGNIRLDYSRGDYQPPIAIVVTGRVPDNVKLYTSHFATCPNAAQHRKRH
jgi:hypothetical protein